MEAETSEGLHNEHENAHQYLLTVQEELGTVMVPLVLPCHAVVESLFPPVAPGGRHFPEFQPLHTCSWLTP